MVNDGHMGERGRVGSTGLGLGVRGERGREVYVCMYDYIAGGCGGPGGEGP